MKLHIEQTHIPDLIIVRRESLTDDRGYFVEQFRTDEFEAVGLPSSFAQINQSGPAY